MMKIAFLGKLNDEQVEFYNHELKKHDLTFFDKNLDHKFIPKQTDFDCLSIFVHCDATKKILSQFPNLKFIAVRSTGFDNVDLEYCANKKIIVSNVPAYGSHTVAEFAIGLLLSLSRQIPQAVEQVKHNLDLSQDGLRGFDLFGKTIGVIGTGKIGTNVIRIALGLGMKVLAYDAFPNKELSSQLNFEYVELTKLLRNSDIVTLHAPATKETYHLINKQNIHEMKKGSVLINTARGTLLDTEALYNSLKLNHLAGAALDVLEEEEDLSSIAKKLIEMPNVLYTPHIAFYTKEAENSIMQTTVDNILGFGENKPVNQVKS